MSTFAQRQNRERFHVSDFTWLLPRLGRQFANESRPDTSIWGRLLLIDGCTTNGHQGANQQPPVVDQIAVHAKSEESGQDVLRHGARQVAFFISGAIACGGAVLALSVAFSSPAGAASLPSNQLVARSTVPATTFGSQRVPAPPARPEASNGHAVPAVPMPPVDPSRLSSVAPVASTVTDAPIPLDPLARPRPASAAKGVGPAEAVPPSRSVAPRSGFDNGRTGAEGPTSNSRAVSPLPSGHFGGLPVPIPGPGPLSLSSGLRATVASDGSSPGHGAGPLELLPPPVLLLPVLVAGGVVVERTRSRRLLPYSRLAPPG